MIIHSKSVVTKSNNWVIKAKESFLKHDTLSLKLNGLKVVTKLELDTSKFRDASSNIPVHRTSNLKHNINTL